jgi:hypothetical protein
MIRDVYPGSGFFYPSRIPDSGVKKTPDPGFGSTTLELAKAKSSLFFKNKIASTIKGKKYLQQIVALLVKNLSKTNLHPAAKTSTKIS